MEKLKQEIQRAEHDEEALLRIYARLESAVGQRHISGKLEFYKPNAKQLEFHKLGRVWQRAIFANNRGGKTTCGAVETAFHATGLYPDWWREEEGFRKFHRPIRAVVLGINYKQLRRSAQRVLMGDGSKSWGEGWLPKRHIVEKGIRMHHGVPDVIDLVQVHHVSGGTSYIYFTTSEMDWQSQQGDALDWIWIDEEIPPSVAMGIYDELCTRTWDTDGRIILTMTPQRGVTDFVNMFWQDGQGTNDDHRVLVRMTIDEAEHLPAATRERIKEEVWKRFPHMAQARLEGIPVFGSGLIYPFTKEQVGQEIFAKQVQNWRHLSGMDLGYSNSYTGVVWGSEPERAGVCYVWDCLMERQKLPGQIAPPILQRDRLMGTDIPMAMPRDAGFQEKVSGQTAARIYRELGLNVLWQPDKDKIVQASLDPGGVDVDGEIALIHMMLYDGKIKISTLPHMEPFWRQMAQYSRDEEGKIVKTKNNQFDLMDAFRYMYVMMHRGFARARRNRRQQPQVVRLAGADRGRPQWSNSRTARMTQRAQQIGDWTDGF